MGLFDRLVDLIKFIVNLGESSVGLGNMVVYEVFYVFNPGENDSLRAQTLHHVVLADEVVLLVLLIVLADPLDSQSVELLIVDRTGQLPAPKELVLLN